MFELIFTNFGIKFEALYKQIKNYNVRKFI